MRWLRGCGTETELVSGSSDGDAIVWNLNVEIEPILLKGHSGNVNIVDGLYGSRDRKETFVVTVSVDSTIKIWYRHQTKGRKIFGMQ